MSVRRSALVVLAVTVAFLTNVTPRAHAFQPPPPQNQTSVLSVNAAGSGNSIWTDTGLYVQQGDTVAIEADTSSTWCSGGIKSDGTASCGGPDGIRPPSAHEHPTTLFDDSDIGLLIGRVGQYTPFAVGGSSYNGNIVGSPSGELYVFPAPQSGELYLAMNDVVGTYGDNSGAIGVSVIDDGSTSTCGSSPQQNLHACSFTPVLLPPPPP